MKHLGRQELVGRAAWLLKVEPEASSPEMESPSQIVAEADPRDQRRLLEAVYQQVGVFIPLHNFAVNRFYHGVVSYFSSQVLFIHKLIRCLVSIAGQSCIESMTSPTRRGSRFAAARGGILSASRSCI